MTTEGRPSFRQPFTPRRQLRADPARPGGGRPFAKFLAYEARPYVQAHAWYLGWRSSRRPAGSFCLQGCFQICLTAIGTSPSQPEALSFVQCRCADLKSAFGLSGSVLPVAAKENEAPPSVGVEWYTSMSVRCISFHLRSVSMHAYAYNRL